MGAIIGILALWLLIAPKPWAAAAQVQGKMDTLDYVRIYGWVASAVNITGTGDAGHPVPLVGGKLKVVERRPPNPNQRQN